MKVLWCLVFFGMRGISLVPLRLSNASVTVAATQVDNVVVDANANETTSAVNNINNLTYTTSYNVPVSNMFSNYYLAAYEYQNLFYMFTPDFFISLASHLLNINPDLSSTTVNNGRILTNFKYIDKTGEQNAFQVPFTTSMRDAQTADDFFALLFELYPSECLQVIRNMNFSDTMRMYMENGTVKTSLKNDTLDIYLEQSDGSVSLTERKGLLQALMNRALGDDFEDLATDAKVFYKPTLEEAQNIYANALNGILPSNVLAIMQYNPNERCFAFDSQKMIGYLEELFNNASVAKLIDDYLAFFVELASFNLASYDVVDAIWDNKVALNKVIETPSEFANLNQLENWLSSYSDFIPEFTNVWLNASTKDERAKAILEGYGLPVNSVLKQKLIDILKDSVEVSNINFGYVGAFRNKAVESSFYPSNTYSVVLPLDPVDEIKYSGFASHVSLGQKTSLLALLDVFTSQQLNVLQEALKPRGYDYTSSSFSSTQTYQEFGGLTISEFIEEVCSKAKTFIVRNNKTLWEVWQDVLKRRYYEMEDKWDNETVPVMRMFFETKLYDKVYSKPPVGTYPLIHIVGASFNSKYV